MADTKALANDSEKNGASAEKRPTSGGVNHWTFFTNHAHVLIQLYVEPELVLREVAANVGITERAVQRILTELEEAGYVERERVGRRNRYRISGDKHLRHPIEAHCQIADLVGMVSRRKE